MRKYIIHRAILMIVTLFMVATLMFFLFRLLPGDPTITVLSPALNPEAQKAMRQHFGLDKPLYQQYAVYLKNILELDFGYSFQHSRRVAEMISGRMANTLVLVLSGIIISYIIGVFGGAFIAWRRGSKTEIAAVILSTTFQSAPVFWVGLVAILVFSVKLDLFPMGHIVTPGLYREMSLGVYFSIDFLHHLFLPLVVTTLHFTCFPLLLMRSSMLEVLGEDFIELCKMKGLSEKEIIYKHAMRNSLLPVATTMPFILGRAVAGQVVIETVFSWPGIGLLMIEAILKSDYPVAQACFLLIAVITIIGNFCADLVYGLLDPRIVYK
jgi:peptide/nickel transport system permease protein